MENEKNFFSDIKVNLKEYVHDRILLLKLEAVEKTSRLVSMMFLGLVVTVLCLFIILFVSLMGGYYFAAITGNIYIGFGIVCGFYLMLLLIILFVGKMTLHHFITNIVIETIFDQTTEKYNDNDNIEST